MLKEKWKRAWAWINQTEDFTPEVFVKSQWQIGETSTLYLLYRWMLAGVFVCGMIASMLDIGREVDEFSSPFYHYMKWPIYLTNWGYTVCTLQAIMSTVHVTKHYVKMRYKPDSVSDKGKMKRSYTVYWILHSIAVVCALVITVLYWGAVYNPKYESLDAVNLTVHLFNSVLMVIDLWVVAHPFKITQSYWPFAFGCLYLIFNYLYFCAGGTSRINRVYIYKIMDWRLPADALVAVAGTIILGALASITVWIMSFIRRRLANFYHHKIHSRQTANATDQGPRIV